MKRWRPEEVLKTRTGPGRPRARRCFHDEGRRPRTRCVSKSQCHQLARQRDGTRRQGSLCGLHCPAGQRLTDLTWPAASRQTHTHTHIYIRAAPCSAWELLGLLVSMKGRRRRRPDCQTISVKQGFRAVVPPPANGETNTAIIYF